MCGVDVDVVKVIRLVLKLGGFTSEKESPDDFTGVGDAITAVGRGTSSCGSED